MTIHERQTWFDERQTWFDKLEEARKLSKAERAKHAIVSHRYCKCKGCFCCACLEIQQHLGESH
jgi:hypothetical protein